MANDNNKEEEEEECGEKQEAQPETKKRLLESDAAAAAATAAGSKDENKRPKLEKKEEENTTGSVPEITETTTTTATTTETAKKTESLATTTTKTAEETSCANQLGEPETIQKAVSSDPVAVADNNNNNNNHQSQQDEPERDQRPKSKRRWRAHQMMEDYIDSVSSLMNPGIVLDPYYNDQTTGSRSGSTSTGTMERLTLLGYMESPLRRPSVWERWSPYEVAVFEGFLGLWGKRFCTLAKRLPHKSTKDVVAFYYVWKKTQHYQRWKQTYRPDEDEIRFQAAKKHKK